MALSYLYPDPATDPTIPKLDAGNGWDPTSVPGVDNGPQVQPPMAAPEATQASSQPAPQPIAGPATPGVDHAPEVTADSGRFQDPLVRSYLSKLAGLDAQEPAARRTEAFASIPMGLFGGLAAFGDGLMGHPGASAGALQADRAQLHAATTGAIDAQRAGLNKNIDQGLRLSQEERLVDQNRRIAKHQEDTTDIQRTDLERRRKKDEETEKEKVGKADPTSPRSVAARDFLVKLHRAAGQNQIADAIEATKPSEDQLQHMPQFTGLLRSEEATKSRENIAAAAETGKNSRASVAEAGKATRHADSTAHKGEWTPTTTAKWQSDMAKALSGVGGRAGELGKTVARVNAAGRADALIQQIRKQKDGPDSRQTAELAQSVASMISNGGQAAQSQIEHLIPHTGAMKLADIEEYIKNQPAGSGSMAFINRLAETVAREKDTSTKQKDEMQDRLLPGFQEFRRGAPQAYDEVFKGTFHDGAAGKPDAEARRTRIKQLEEEIAAHKAGKK